jgi:hypothetical protein
MALAPWLLESPHKRIRRRKAVEVTLRLPDWRSTTTLSTRIDHLDSIDFHDIHHQNHQNTRRIISSDPNSV